MNSAEEIETSGGDFTQLQREYRNMENNRKSYTDESQQLLRRQQTSIEKLKKDNDKLKSEIALQTKHVTKSIATAQQNQLVKLQDQVEQYATKMGSEQNHLDTLQQQINIMRQKVLHQKKHLGGVNASKENHQMINKQIRILENRLDKALVKFNEALAHNKELRDNIDNLRKERLVFDNIYRKLERELHEQKKQMANIIEMSNLAYEQRDNAQMEVAAIEQMNRQEIDEFDRKMLEMTEKIENSKKITAAIQQSNSAIHTEATSRGEMTIEQESKLKRKFNKGAWGMAKDKVNVQVSIERVQNFEEAFNKIKAATGITDIEELVQTFIKHEDQNFSLFNYVNEQANEIEKLEEQLQRLREEESRYAEANGEDANQHKQLLKDLELRLQATDASAEKHELKCVEAQKIINSLKVGIQSIFSKLECSSAGMPEMMGDGIVTEANIMQLFGIIEQRTNETLQLYAAAQKSKQEAEEGAADARAGIPASQLQMVLGVGPSTSRDHEQLQINPPNLDDYSSEEDSEEDEDDMRPLTHDELKLRTLKGLHKKNNKEATSRRKAKAKK